MIKYTLEEIRHLAPIYDDSSDPKIYAPLIETIIEEKKSPTDVLMEFFGAYLYIVHDSTSRKELYDFLFINNLENMPLYLNDSTKSWKKNISHWRMSIGK